MHTLVLAALLALPQVNDGAIEVTVHDPDTRQEIPAVRVTIALVPTQPTEPSNLVVSSSTDGKGFAEFKNLVYGVYRVRIEREGYGPVGAGDTVSVFVRDSAPRQKIEFNLTRAVSLSGEGLAYGAQTKSGGERNDSRRRGRLYDWLEWHRNSGVTE